MYSTKCEVKYKQINENKSIRSETRCLCCAILCFNQPFRLEQWTLLTCYSSVDVEASRVKIVASGVNSSVSYPYSEYGSSRLKNNKNSVKKLTFVTLKGTFQFHGIFCTIEAKLSTIWIIHLVLFLPGSGYETKNFGSRKKFRIQPDSDSLHCFLTSIAG